MDILNEIVRVLELLKNLVFRSNEAKVLLHISPSLFTNCPASLLYVNGLSVHFLQLKAIDAGVVSVLQQLWSWCTVTKAMCSAVLELLCTLTARCPQGW